MKSQKENNLAVAWNELEQGALVREAADKCGINRRTLSDRLLREDPERYNRIMIERHGARRTSLDLTAIWTQLERGLSITRIAKEHGISRPALTRKLRKDNLRRYTAIMKERIQNRDRHINLKAIWTEIENGKSIRRIAEERMTTPATLYYRLRRAHAGKYAKITRAIKRRPRTQIPVEAWDRLANGESMTKLCKEYGISHRTLQKRLRQTDPKRYARIRSRFGSYPRLVLPWKTIWARFKQGEKITSLARQYNVSHEYLFHGLQERYGDKYKEFMTKNRVKGKIERARELTPDDVWRRLRRGETVEKIASELGLGGRTLSYRLEQIDKVRYRRLMDNRKPEVPPTSDLWRELEKGHSLTELAKRYNIPRKTLSRRLQNANSKKYRETMRTANLKHKISKRQLFSLRRQRIQGAESQFELQVRKILESHNIQFEYRSYLKLGRHVYFPDFRLPYDTLIEAAGVSFRTYWQHYRSKVRSYIRHGYNVVIVVPRSLRRKAEEYLPRGRVVVRIDDLDERIEHTLTRINTAFAMQFLRDSSKRKDNNRSFG
jgi:transposase-like protein